MIERKAYQCEHCKTKKTMPRIFLDRRNAYAHECSCFYNPKNKTCFTCVYNNREFRHGFKVSLGCEKGHITKEDVEERALTHIFNDFCPCDDWNDEYAIEEVGNLNDNS